MISSFILFYETWSQLMRCHINPEGWGKGKEVRMGSQGGGEEDTGRGLIHNTIGCNTTSWIIIYGIMHPA